MLRRLTLLLMSLVLMSSALLVSDAGVVPFAGSAATAATTGPLHTTGNDSVIYDAANRPVRLVGFNWTGTELGGRSDYQKTADACGAVWRTPADPMGSGLTFDNMYQVLRDWGYNVIRLPISWNNLEPVAPVWNATAGAYVHTWNATYLNDLKSMVAKARANGLMVILDMHQDYWSPAMHHITNWNGTPGYCEGVGLPRWMYPTMDAKPSTTQVGDVYNGVNWFYRNLADPLSTVTHATPWQLLAAAWDQIGYQFSPASGFADSQAIIGADILNEPYFSFVGGSPPSGQTVLQAAGARLLAFYNALAPALTARHPAWLLFFQDATGGYNAANPAARETPTMTAKPTAPGNWVYSLHAYNLAYGTFADGVVRHDDFGITVMTAALTNANAWRVPLYIGEFTNFSLGVDARQLTDATMVETGKFLSWAKQNSVSWSFWAYVNTYLPMTVVDPATNQAIPVVKRALDAGRDAPSSNAPPVASFTSTCNLLTCAFDGTSSTDPDGSITGYAWNFGDGTTSSASEPNHTYATAGTYSVTLTVTDNAGGIAANTSPVTVASASLYASDAFARVVTNGWGVADRGGSWTAVGSVARFGVNGGRGAITMPTPGSGPSIFLNAVSSASTDVQVTATTDRAPTGGGVYLSVVARRVVGVGDYRAKIRLRSTGQVGISVARVSATGVETAVTTDAVVPGLTYTAQTALRVRVQAAGTNPTVLRAKVWAATAVEPAAWGTTGSDSTAALQLPGGVGLMSYLSGSSTNAPIVARFDDFRAGPSG